jgi:hypothetical protein
MVMHTDSRVPFEFAQGHSNLQGPHDLPAISCLKTNELDTYKEVGVEHGGDFIHRSTSQRTCQMKTTTYSCWSLLTCCS